MIKGRQESNATNNIHSFALFLFALANYVLMYAANIKLAHVLRLDDFNDYNVALSTVTMLSTIATLGLEKYALRAISLFRERQDWSRFRGFWLFSIRAILGFSVVLFLMLGSGLETLLALNHAGYHIAIVIFAGFLPIIALALFLVEILAAHGEFLVSVALYRLALPFLYLLSISLISSSPIGLSAVTAVICLGGSWTIICIILWKITRSVMPSEIAGAKPAWRNAIWLSRSLPLVLNSLMLTVMTSAGVVVLDLLHPSELEVGIYAVCAQTGSFISLLGTSTNRYYLPRMVVMAERLDKRAMQHLLSKRAAFIGSLVVGLLAFVVTFGQSILNLFGPQFNTGYHTLVIIAVGASVSAFFAEVPYFLQFMGLNRTVLYMTLTAMLSMLVLGFILGDKFGSLGVALAYALPVSLLFISLSIIADIRLRRMSQKP